MELEFALSKFRYLQRCALQIKDNIIKVNVYVVDENCAPQLRHLYGEPPRLHVPTPPHCSTGPSILPRDLKFTKTVATKAVDNYQPSKRSVLCFEPTEGPTEIKRLQKLVSGTTAESKALLCTLSSSENTKNNKASPMSGPNNKSSAAKTPPAAATLSKNSSAGNVGGCVCLHQVAACPAPLRSLPVVWGFYVPAVKICSTTKTSTRKDSKKDNKELNEPASPTSKRKLTITSGATAAKPEKKKKQKTTPTEEERRG
eukprot:TRINITY_DN67779_c7_g3_i3.p1 TRINITY_DN67779_c7_g3~~TRINITY_DN67779_c7_g3_i3.p1  ORF type:complete len:257 (-),score=50.75 TRINITY_DN67779_c7_g3_i3:868-1638(-)